jgi:cytochrome c oxidase subunit 2
MNKNTTLYLYELAWMLPSVAIPVGMLAALLVTAFGAHIGLPGDSGRIEVSQLAHTPPFDQPGVVEIAPAEQRASRVVASLER